MIENAKGTKLQGPRDIFKLEYKILKLQKSDFYISHLQDLKKDLHLCEICQKVPEVTIFMALISIFCSVRKPNLTQRYFSSQF